MMGVVEDFRLDMIGLERFSTFGPPDVLDFYFQNLLLLAMVVGLLEVPSMYLESQRLRTTDNVFWLSSGILKVRWEQVFFKFSGSD